MLEQREPLRAVGLRGVGIGVADEPIAPFVPDAAHLAQLDQPELTFRALDAFLEA